MKRRSEDKSLAELQRNAPLDPRREAALERVRAKVAAVTALVSSTAAGLRRCGMLPFAPRDGASATSAASQRRHSDARRLRADADMIRRVLDVQEACVARCLAKAQHLNIQLNRHAPSGGAIRGAMFTSPQRRTSVSRVGAHSSPAARTVTPSHNASGSGGGGAMPVVGGPVVADLDAPSHPLAHATRRTRSSVRAKLLAHVQARAAAAPAAQVVDATASSPRRQPRAGGSSLTLRSRAVVRRVAADATQRVRTGSRIVELGAHGGAGASAGAGAGAGAGASSGSGTGAGNGVSQEELEMHHARLKQYLMRKGKVRARVCMCMCMCVAVWLCGCVWLCVAVCSALEDNTCVVWLHRKRTWPPFGRSTDLGCGKRSRRSTQAQPACTHPASSSLAVAMAVSPLLVNSNPAHRQAVQQLHHRRRHPRQ